MLRFVIGSVEAFNIASIEVASDRRSVDGSKAMKHIELLSDAEFDAVRFNQSFEFLSDDALFELIQTPEWKLPEE